MSTTRPRSRRELGGELDGLVAAAAGGQVDLVHAVAAGQLARRRSPRAAEPGSLQASRAQPLGELAARRVGVDADDPDPGGGQQLHHQLPDQAEADDQRQPRRAADSPWRTPCIAIDADGAERGVPRRDAVAAPAA